MIKVLNPLYTFTRRQLKIRPSINELKSVILIVKQL
jgi:hypothetical protein